MKKFTTNLKKRFLWLALAILSIKSYGAPLNVRNNNPCNIKYMKNNDWVGSIRKNGVFEVFEDQYTGIRACTLVIMANIKATDSVDNFVLRFATEPNESLESAHIHNYSRALKDMLGYETKISFSDIIDVLKTVVRMEGGAEASEFYRHIIEEDLN